MNVVGLTAELKSAAEEQCREGFLDWLKEVRKLGWKTWEELKRHYPKASQVTATEVHFPLLTDGTGVRTRIFFDSRLIHLLSIAPAPLAARIQRRPTFSMPQI